MELQNCSRIAWRELFRGLWTLRRERDFFNYESPLRSTEFVTRKITSGVAGFVVHGRYPLLLGNLAAKRDWGSAKEYVDGMWRILQAPAPDAFVLATGRTETIRTFVNVAYATQGIELEWEGSGKE
jgi:GDPmannose 4,6-dehydratase